MASVAMDIEEPYSLAGRTYRNTGLHVRDLVNALRAHARAGGRERVLQVTVEEGRELSLTARILLR